MFNIPGSRGLARQIRQRIAAYFSSIQISANISNNVPAPPAGTLFSIRGLDGTTPRALLDSYGATSPTFEGRMARGTAVAPTATQLNDILCAVAGRGYGATGYSGQRTGFAAIASENWTDAAQGAEVDIYTTPVGGTTLTKRYIFANDGGFYANGATGGSQGSGTGNFTGIYKNGVDITPGGAGGPPINLILDYDYVAPPALGGFTQFNISGSTSIAQSTQGNITIKDTGTNALQMNGVRIAHGLTAPFRIAFYFQFSAPNANFAGFNWGWSDGTKFDVISMFDPNAGNYGIGWENWSNSTTRVTSSGTVTNQPISAPGILSNFWAAIHDDNAGNVIFEWSADGVNWIPLRTVVKSSGYLGSTGYTQYAFALRPDSTLTTVLVCRLIDTNGLTRAFP